MVSAIHKNLGEDWATVCDLMFHKPPASASSGTQPAYLKENANIDFYDTKIIAITVSTMYTF